jgi:hypothetical protein
VTRIGLELVAAKAALDLAGPEGFPAAATVALTEGVDSPALRVLAGLSEADVDQASALLGQALEELNLPAPTPRTAVLDLARELAREILDATLAPHEGARRIWDLTLRVQGEDLPELDSFVYAASEWEERPEDRAHFEAGIISAARDLLDT